ncbi:hypothetical protein [Saccharothrix stipae]
MTDAGGRYRFAAVPAGQYKLRYQWPSFTEQWWPGKHDSWSAQQITVVTGVETAVDEVALPVGDLEITITDSATGAPMPGVCVSASGPHFVSGCADSGGKVELGPARVGRWHVTANPPAGYLYGSVDQDVVAEQTTTASIAMDREAVLDLTFVDAVTGRPVPRTCVAEVDEGARGSVPQYLDTCADSAGRLRLGMRFTGRTKLFARPTDGVHGSQWVGPDGGTGDVDQAAWHVLRSGETTSVTIRLDPAGTISGTVTAAATGAEVSGVCVIVAPAAPWSVNPYEPNCTYGSGAYTIRGLGPYDWPVQFPDRSGRYAWQWSGNAADRHSATPVRVHADQVTTADAALTAAGVLTGRITGLTIPWHYASVYAVNARTGDWAAPQAGMKSPNQYTIAGLGTQAVRIAFTPTNEGLQWHPVPVDVTAGATTTVDLTAN